MALSKANLLCLSWHRFLNGRGFIAGSLLHKELRTDVSVVSKVMVVYVFDEACVVSLLNVLRE